MKKRFGKPSARQSAQAGGRSAERSTRAANWHLIPDELFAGIKDIVAREAQSIIPAGQEQGQGKVKWDYDATLKYLNATDADDIAGKFLRGMKSNFSNMEQWAGLSKLLKNLPRMENQEVAAEALLKTWAALLCGCKYTPPEIMTDSEKIRLLHRFTYNMEHLENPQYVPENFHSDTYKKNAKNLQRTFFKKAVPEDLYSTLTCVLPDAGNEIPGHLFSLGQKFGLENSRKYSEAKALLLTGFLEDEAGLRSYIDGDMARSQVARRVVEWRFTHVEGKEPSSVLDISGCGVDRVPPIARLRDVPARDSSRSELGAFRNAVLTDVNASGNRFPKEELKTLRNLGLRVHLGNNIPPLSKAAINRLNWFQGRNTKTTFTLEAPARSQASQEHQPVAATPSREPGHEAVFSEPLRPSQSSTPTQTAGRAHVESPESTAAEKPSSSRVAHVTQSSGSGRQTPPPTQGRS